MHSKRNRIRLGLTAALFQSVATAASAQGQGTLIDSLRRLAPSIERPALREVRAVVLPDSAKPTNRRLALEFRQALQNDPEYQSAIAERDGGVENLDQALAALLPQISATAQRSVNDTDSTSQTSLGPVERSFNNYPAYNVNVQVRQALYRPKSWANLAVGRAQSELSELRLLAARQDLAVRLLSIHADWSFAAASATTAEGLIAIHERLFAYAQRQFEAGDSTRTEVEVARAKLEQAKSQLAEAKASRASAQLAWEQITGITPQNASHFLPLLLSDQVAEVLPPTLPALTRLRESALSTNPLIRAQKTALVAAREALRRAQAERQPAADLYASRSQSKSALDNTIGTEFRTTQIGVQVSVPIYSGGAIDSGVRQAEAGVRRAESELNTTTARLRLQIERDWHGLDAARIEAAAQRQVGAAMRLVAETAVRGRMAGIAARGEEEQATIQLLTAQKSLSAANARALVFWGRLVAALGTLDADILDDLDQRVATGATN